jgi:hypothetical protein
MRRSRRLGIAGVAAATAKASRWVTLARVIGWPSRLGSSADVDTSAGFSLSQARTALTVDRHNGIVRCLRPLPCKCNARCAMAAAVNPAELSSQVFEDAVNLPVANGLAQQAPPTGDEDRQLGRAAHMPGSLRSVACQHLDGARVQRHQPRLAELALPDPQHAILQVHVGIEQPQCLGDCATPYRR